jgi:uncharacterized membrane protein YagU involved in acid resistance
MKNAIRNAILALNYGIAVAICMILVVWPQFSFGEKAMYGISAIFFGMGVQRLVRKLMPVDPAASD